MAISLFYYSFESFQSNHAVEKLDLEDNDIGPEGAVCLAEMLQDNETIRDVVRHFV